MMQKEDQPQSLRPFFTIWAGQAFSLLGSQLVQFAIVWYLAKTTGSATMLAMATLAALLPQILIGPFAGALVDRWNRRQVMLVVDAGIAAATLLLAGLFWMDLAQVWLIYLLLTVRATGAAFQWPAMTASTTMMVPQKHLARVAGLNQILSGFAAIFIPPIGALAIETLSIQGVLAIDVATAIPAIVSLLFIPIPQPAHAATTGEGSLLSSLWADMREGWRFIWNWKAFMVLMVIAIMINLLGRAAASLAPLMVLEYFGGGALELGWWQSAIFLDGLAIIAITMTPKTSFAVVVALIFVVAFLETIAIGLGGALGQILIPPEMQGRVFGLVMSLSLALSPLGLLVAGPVADAFGVQFWWVLTGLMISGMGALALAIPAVVRIEDTKRQV